ncbi:MAG: GNAT family N-acetyltransferase [Proteobacteria bacterium]|jgi:predicted acetyltransferase|nr:GNAT family N-acetyltransferase [Pseudomonadota bacterium]
MKNQARLIPATLADYPAIQNMARFYVYDISRTCGFLSHEWACPKDGLYECFDFKIYFAEENRRAFLIKVDEELAGFALLHKQCKGEKNYWEMGEFFIFGKFQSKGIGEKIAREIWQQFQGSWEVLVIPENIPAYGFWKSVITKYTYSCFTESVEKVDFDVHQPQRIIFKFESSPYHLRLATIEDAAAIVDLQIRGWKHAYKSIIDQSYLDHIYPEKRLNWRLENMAKGDNWTFVVEHNGKIVGECDAGYSSTPEFGKGEIFALYVDKDHHRKGIATMLWKTAVEKLRQENLVPFIVITLTKNSPARAFYQSMGCIACSEVQTTIDGKLYDEVVYACKAHKQD